MARDIYVITCTKISPGESVGYIGDLLENASTDISVAEELFKNLVLNKEYFRKELWVIEPGGRRKLLKEERFK